ncbi:hypothetical protein KBD49_12335 [Myxococcota bacterium]|nr:hypothetical protein [Myxococcota bacterium]
MVPSHRFACRGTLLAVATVLAVACGGGKEGEDGLIGPEGGTLTLPGGGRLVVPPGALSEPTRLQATSIAAPEGAGFKAVGPFHEFGPAGLAFAKPAELFVPYDGAGVPADSLGVAWSADGTTWERLETTVDAATGEMRAAIQHFSKGGPASWNQVCCMVDLGPEGTEVSLSTYADCKDALSKHPGAKVTILFDLDRCKVCCADDWTKKPLVDCKQPAANEQECEPVCCAIPDPGDGEYKLELMAGGACHEDELDIFELDAKDCDTVCCTVTEGDIVTVSLVPRTVCEDLGLDQNKLSEESDPEGCAACCADDWTKKPLVDCKQPAANEQECEPVCCHKGDASPSWVIRGMCVAEGGTPGNEPESECGGCKNSYDCMSLDTDPHDCMTFYCIAGKCISAPSGEGTLCDDGNACTVEDRCDASGNCKGQPRVCADPPGPKECYVGACNPASGECEYSLALGATCAKDADCEVGFTCQGCTCVKSCQVDRDCPDDSSTDCLVPSCWNNKCETVPKAFGSECDDGDPCTKDDQCTSNGECHGTVQDPAQCLVCCATTWTVIPKGLCIDLGVLPVKDCDIVCCKKGTQVSFIPKGKCLAEGGELLSDADCPGCMNNVKCAPLDNTPADCFTYRCIEHECVEVPVEAGIWCLSDDKCIAFEVCDGSGNCKGEPVGCYQPPAPKKCYNDTGSCNPATGLCEYSLALGATCAKDADCEAGFTCQDCNCVKSCEMDWDCPDDSSTDCLVPSCWNNKCETIPKAPGSKCDDGDPCTKDDQCGSNGECHGTPMDPGECPVCCGDDWTFKPFAACPAFQPDSNCDKTCCNLGGKMTVMAIGACDQAGGAKTMDCQVCCEDTWTPNPFVICPQAAAPIEECDPVCCVKSDRFDVVPRGKCDNALFVLEPAACGFVCCSDTAAGKTAISVVPKWVCDGIANQPGHTVTQSPHENCAVCCLDGFRVRPWTECANPASDESQCEKVCCEILGSKHVVTRAECSDEFETTTPIDQCFNPKLSTCAQPGEVFTGNSAVIQGPFPTPTSTETAEGCPDTWYPDKWPDKTNGPDGVLPVQAPAGSRVVAAAFAKGKRVSTQIKPPCGQSGCYSSSWGNKRPEYPVFHEISYDPYPSNDLYNDLYSVSRGESIAERWTATVKEMSPSQPKAPMFLPLDSSSPLNMDDPVETLDARVVFDSWQEPGQTIEGDFTGWYRVVDGPPPNDTAAGAIVLMEGMPQVPETFAFAGDDYQAAGCAAVPNGTGAGKPDLFYAFTPTATGVYRLEIGLLTEDPPSDAFFAVLDPSGACVASGPGGAPFRSPLTLAANTTYTLIVDAGSLSENAVFFVQVDRYNIQGDPAHQGPLNYSCTSAQAIAGLPFSAEVELSIGFNHIRPQMSCAAILKSTFLHGDRDLLWSYTPPAEQYVRFEITSLSAGFRPTLLLFDACGSEWPATECLDAIRVPSGQTTISFVRKLTAGKTYFIAAEGGSDAPSAVRVTLEEVATNPDPDDCSNPLVLTNLPAKVTLNARNLDDDVAGSGTVPAQGLCCGPSPCAPVGQGLPDAVLAYTATQNGVLDVKFGSGNQGSGILYATTDVCPSGVLDSCTSLSRKATDISVGMDAGQTAYVVVDGWDNGWFQEITLDASFLPRPTNESCESARTVTELPWQETTTLAFTANDVTALNQGCSEVNYYVGDYTSGGDLVWTFDPGPTEKDVIVGMLSANFSGYNEPSLYVLESCGPMPTNDCWDGFIFQSGSYVDNDVTLWGVDAPIWIVVDHKTVDVPGTFTWMAQEVTTPPNDTCATATAVTGLPFRHVFNNVLATDDYSLAVGNTCENFGNPVGWGPDLVYRLDITAELLATYRTIRVNTAEATFSVSLMAFQNGCDPATHCVAAKQYRYLTVPLDGFVAGDVLYLVVDGMATNSEKSAGMFVLEIEGA